MKTFLCQITSAILNVSHMYIKFSKLVRKCWGCILPGAGVGVFGRKCMSLQSQLVNNWDTNSFRLPPHLQICRTRLLHALCIYGQCTAILIWNMKKEISQFSSSSNWFHIVPKAVKTAPGQFFLKMFTWATKAACSLRTCGHSWPGQRL